METSEIKIVNGKWVYYSVTDDPENDQVFRKWLDEIPFSYRTQYTIKDKDFDNHHNPDGSVERLTKHNMIPEMVTEKYYWDGRDLDPSEFLRVFNFDPNLGLKVVYVND